MSTLPDIGEVSTTQIDGLDIRLARSGATEGVAARFVIREHLGLHRLGFVRPAVDVGERLNITPGAPARLRGPVPAWRLPRPLHRGQSGREIPFLRSPQPASRGEHREAAGAVAARGVICRPPRPAARGAPWCAESGLTKGGCGWQDYHW